MSTPIRSAYEQYEQINACGGCVRLPVFSFGANVPAQDGEIVFPPPPGMILMLK